jgi:ribosome hibernation promoting factor
MNIAYTTRGLELTDQIKHYTEEKLRKILSKDELLDIAVTLVQERHLFKAELLVHNRNARVYAIEETPDVFKSIHAVINKVEKQLRRHKGKLIGRKRKAPVRAKQLTANMAPEQMVTSRVIRARKQDIKPMSQEEALMQLDAREEPFLIFRNTKSDRINVLFRRKDGNYGIIDSEI